MRKLGVMWKNQCLKMISRFSIKEVVDIVGKALSLSKNEFFVYKEEIISHTGFKGLKEKKMFFFHLEDNELKKEIIDSYKVDNKDVEKNKEMEMQFLKNIMCYALYVKLMKCKKLE